MSHNTYPSGPTYAGHILSSAGTLGTGTHNHNQNNYLTSSLSHRRSLPLLSPLSSSPIMMPSTHPLPMVRIPNDRNWDKDASTTSLAINYIPNKFTKPMITPTSNGARKRRGNGNQNGYSSNNNSNPKFGGGVEAFKAGEARVGGQGNEDDDDDDGITIKTGGVRPKGKKARWNKFKWALFISNSVLTIYSLTGLIACLLTWFGIWHYSDVIVTGNHTDLTISTLAASLGLFVAVIGWAGILLNNRTFLAIYSFLLWIVFIFLVIPGYLSYKRRTFNLEGKINAQWSRDLGAQGRLRIQNQLMCCGYFSPYVEATVSQTCYSRSVLSGCKSRYLNFQRKALWRWYTIVFCLVPAHLAVMMTAGLCSNHVTYRFGKGMMPEAYRLSLHNMAIIIDNYANQLATRYGLEVPSEVPTHPRPQLGLNSKHQSSSGDNTSTTIQNDRLASPLMVQRLRPRHVHRQSYQRQRQQQQQEQHGSDRYPSFPNVPHQDHHQPVIERRRPRDRRTAQNESTVL